MATATAIALGSIGWSAASVPAVGADEFPGGRWAGSLSLVDQAELGGLQATYLVSGWFSLHQPLDGSSGWEMQIASTLPEIGPEASATGTAVGTVADGADGLELVLDQVTTRSAGPLGMELTFTADELPDAGAGTLALTGGSCNSLVGDWTVPFNGTELSGTFIARPVLDGWRDRHLELHAEGLTLMEQIRSGAIDAGRIFSFIAEAERAASGTTARDEGCSPEAAGAFNNAATSIIDSLVIQISQEFDAIDDGTFIELHRAAVRTGVFVYNPIVESVWELEWEVRIRSALTTGTPEDWDFWLAVAIAAGDTERAEMFVERLENPETFEIYAEED